MLIILIHTIMQSRKTFIVSDIHMFVCICNQVTDREIRCAVDNGACSMRDISSELNVGTCCGKCKCAAKKVMREALQENAFAQAYPGNFVPALSLA